MAETLTVGQKAPLKLVYLDQHGAVMLAPALDSPPEWSNTNGAVESVVPSEDHLTAEQTAIAAGTDTVHVVVVVAGVTLQGSLDVTVEGQVATTVQIAPGP